jgi:hypothetical protein
MKEVVTENQREFVQKANEYFTFEELALMFYENECLWCSERENCSGRYTTEECLGFIRRQFELDYKDYLAESEG